MKVLSGMDCVDASKAYKKAQVDASHIKIVKGLTEGTFWNVRMLNATSPQMAADANGNQIKGV
jgi:hypothetical protein